jgi:hypothetical protein
MHIKPSAIQEKISRKVLAQLLSIKKKMLAIKRETARTINKIARTIMCLIENIIIWKKKGISLVEVSALSALSKMVKNSFTMADWARLKSPPMIIKKAKTMNPHPITVTKSGLLCCELFRCDKKFSPRDYLIVHE